MLLMYGTNLLLAIENVTREEDISKGMEILLSPERWISRQNDIPLISTN
jgi:hypothetical protein